MLWSTIHIRYRKVSRMSGHDGRGTIVGIGREYRGVGDIHRIRVSRLRRLSITVKTWNRLN
eukprot:scaffold663730_cov75-Attheya_sp.AAC.1